MATLAVGLQFPVMLATGGVTLTVGLLAAMPMVARAQCPDGTPLPCREPPPRHSIAVLSFEARSRDTTDQFLAEGLADDIASRLGQVNRLTVRSREAVRRVRGADTMSVEVLGQRLNAAFVLSGSVRPVGASLHFVFELTQTRTGRIAWSNTYERSSRSLLQLQSDVAQGAARAVLGDLSLAERRKLAKASASSDAAFAHLARGSAFLGRRRLAEAMAELGAAVREDSTSAIAWARLSQAYALCLFLGPASAAPCVSRADSMRPWALSAAARALAADSTVSDAWMADGLNRAVGSAGRADHPRALSSLRRAESLGDQSAELLHTIGSVLLYIGADDAEAIRRLRAALAVDPGRGVTFIYLSRAAWVQGRYREALALLDTARALEPDWETRSDRWRATMALGDTALMRDAWSRYSVSSRQTDTTADRNVRWLEEAFIRLHARDTAAAHVIADSLVAAQNRSPWTALLLVRLNRRAEAADIVRRFPRPSALSWLALRSPAFADLNGLTEFRAYIGEARRLAAVDANHNLPREF